MQIADFPDVSTPSEGMQFAPSPKRTAHGRVLRVCGAFARSRTGLI